MPTEYASLFERVGVPAGFLILMYILYVKTQIWNQKHQETTQKKYEQLATQSQERYENLTNKFIDTMNKIVVENTRCLTDLCQKIDTHTKSKDEVLELIKDKDERLNYMYDAYKDAMKNKK